MKNRIVLLIVLTAMMVAGCAVGPDYHPPKTQAPVNWSEAQLGGATNSAMQIVEWWKTFNDPELNSLIQRAVVSNLDLRVASGRLHQARALRSGAIWDLGPTINGSAGYTDALASKNSLPFPSSGGASNVVSGYDFHTDLYDAHFDATW